ncbi:hypothetical protein D1818_00935 [Aquimarina sp. BL5]|uniref:hypothetical protein n=1 Tax=Aquimarina sp. BL5 TaxID=1714860 RepID=UPI000E4D75C8|nr:hypothetical protein [Aquimarina sp. BL5]AXT49451.1 hypothetical protein D1818_00935 [Aquimarina sp. BL5]RKM98414.1 hypothetical protein D7036_20105 [Aquimarina sp. BL5]
MKFKYTELKETYLEVKKFLEHASGEKINSLNTKIVEDLKLWGDDNYFLLIEFIEKYDLNFEKFEYDKHFDSEGELVGFKTFILGVFKLPVLIINNLLIKHISIKTYKKIDNTLYDRTNCKKDLTFGDLILSKLNGEFTLREN